jgi:quercetin dioxygenase-like cupin family protein
LIVDHPFGSNGTAESNQLPYLLEIFGQVTFEYGLMMRDADMSVPCLTPSFVIVVGYHGAIADQGVDMTIRTSASRVAKAAPASYFTGSVFMDGLASAQGTSRVNANTVTFNPGARTVWHIHDMRQVLVVTIGTGILQIEGSAAQKLQQGDVADVPPGVRHWHGASANSLFAHISILESKEEGTQWLDPVSEDDYRAANATIAA